MIFFDGPNGNITISGRLTQAGVYRALLSQVGTDDPTAKLLESTLGAIVWTRSSAGVYVGTLLGAFTADKTFLLIGRNGVADVCSYDFLRVDNDSVAINSFDGAPVLADDLLSNTPIEIVVYP